MRGQERAYGGLRLERVVAPVLVVLACLFLFVRPALPESLPERLVIFAGVLLVAYCIFDAKVLRVLWKAALVAAPISLLGVASVLALLPVIDGIQVLRQARVRRAKLYYLRKLRGKAARLRDRRRSDSR